VSVPLVDPVVTRKVGLIRRRGRSLVAGGAAALRPVRGSEGSKSDPAQGFRQQLSRPVNRDLSDSRCRGHRGRNQPIHHRLQRLDPARAFCLLFSVDGELPVRTRALLQQRTNAPECAFAAEPLRVSPAASSSAADHVLAFVGGPSSKARNSASTAEALRPPDGSRRSAGA
jgi:hypothetical protein